MINANFIQLRQPSESDSSVDETFLRIIPLSQFITLADRWSYTSWFQNDGFRLMLKDLSGMMAEEFYEFVSKAHKKFLEWNSKFSLHSLWNFRPLSTLGFGRNKQCTTSMKMRFQMIRFFTPKVSVIAIHQPSLWHARGDRISSVSRWKQ